MGRGLSPLQQHVLEQAATLGRVDYSSLLASYFGYTPLRLLDDPAHAGMLTTEYRRFLASLSRACRRLEQRGLIIRHRGRPAAVEITELGRRQLSRRHVA